MGCGCGAGAGASGQPMQMQTFVHTLPDGQQDSYSNETEVAAAVSRQGGTYRILVDA